MDRERPKLLRVRRSQILGDELRQVRKVRPGEALEEVPPPFRVKVLGGQPIQGCILEVVEVLPVREGMRPQGFPRDHLRVEGCRQVRSSPDQSLLVVEVQTDMVAQVS